MHELSIANSILEAVRKERERLNGARVTKVGVRIGELAGRGSGGAQFRV